MDFQGSEIGLCVWVLFYKLWGKIRFNGQLKSEKWWRRRLKELINAPEVAAPPLPEGKPAEPAPIPFEIEMGMPDLNYNLLLKAWKLIPHRD